MAKKKWTGAFFTPLNWVDEVHKLLSENLGENWKDEYVVWDSSCGIGNLTKDYQFRSLYLSTLEQKDIDIIKKNNTNPEATIFQFDFLNDDFIDLPMSLRLSLINGKKVLFLNNPPYVTSTSRKEYNVGISTNEVNKVMSKAKVGAASRQLYLQFMFRIIKTIEKYNLKDAVMATISPSAFMSGCGYKGFRNHLSLTFMDGMIFPATDFSDELKNWAISFTIFKNKEINQKKTIFPLKLKKCKNDKIVDFGIRTLYNLDGQPETQDWIREPIKDLKPVDAPQLVSAIKCKQKGQGKIVDGALGYILSNGGNIQNNLQLVAMFSSCYVSAHGISIMESNFNRVVPFFAARKLVLPTWINEKDEYLIPNEKHPLYQQFVNDSIVFSIFSASSNQSSLRNVDYKGKLYNIHNHFFFMSLDAILKLGIQHNFKELVNDCNGQIDRYAYLRLETTNLSEDAKILLNMARELVVKSFQVRMDIHSINQEFNLHAWDAGWYQIRNGILKENFKKDYDDFNDVYKKFYKRMKPLVYELGFLKIKD